MSTSEVIAIVVAVLGVVAAVLQALGKKAAASAVEGIGAAVDRFKKVVPAETAKTLTAAIKTETANRGVLGLLDRILKRSGLNAKSRAEMLRETETRPPEPGTAPAGG